MPAKKQRTIGFGFDPVESPAHFAVVLPRAEKDHVVIEECYVWNAPASEAQRKPTPKAYLDSYRWSRIADVTRAQFNKRLRDVGQDTAQWKTGGQTPLAPYFGKEITLLAWAIEDADPTLIPNMVANWLGLAPEERWWLYTTINATSGHPEHGRDRGWRKAIKIAFGENPAGAPADKLPEIGSSPVPLHLPVDAERRSDPVQNLDEPPIELLKRRRRKPREVPHAQLEFQPEDKK